jgi:branched-chain amino acid transport system substrate-binding protein
MKRLHEIVGGVAALGLAMLATPANAAGMSCGLSNGKPATGKPINIGAIITASGGADISNAAKSAKAYFECVNANGGINGRPVNYIWEDDQTRPDKAAEIAKKLVEDDNVVALVGSASIVDCIATAQYYKDNNVISIMAAAIAPQCFNARNVAALNSGPRYGLIAAVSYAAKNLGIKHIVCPQPTFPGAEWICDGIKTFAELAGIKYSMLTFDQTSADNDSLVAQIMQTGADATVYVGSPVTMPPFLAAAEQADAGSQMIVLAPSPVYNPMIPQTVGPYWNDKLWVSLEFGPLDANSADTLNFLALAKVSGAKPDSFGQMGYLTARLATEAMLTIDPSKIDRASVTEALQKVQDFKSDMLCGSWAFGGIDDTARLGNRAGWIAEMHDGGWQVKAGCNAIDPRVIR